MIVLIHYLVTKPKLMKGQVCKCIYCVSDQVIKNGFSNCKNRYQKIKCKSCGKNFQLNYTYQGNQQKHLNIKTEKTKEEYVAELFNIDLNNTLMVRLVTKIFDNTFFY